MNASTIIFYVLAALILGGGLMAVTSGKIFRAAIFLLFSLIGIAGLYLYLNYQFITAVQILVYVGGIIVMIIFSIFLTHQTGHKMKKPGWGRAIISALIAIAGFGMTVLFITRQTFTPSSGQAVEQNMKAIGIRMLSTTHYGYALPFEAVSMLLLAAMIGCIVIAMKITPKE